MRPPSGQYWRCYPALICRTAEARMSAGVPTGPLQAAAAALTSCMNFSRAAGECGISKHFFFIAPMAGGSPSAVSHFSIHFEGVIVAVPSEHARQNAVGKVPSRTVEEQSFVAVQRWREAPARALRPAPAPASRSRMWSPPGARPGSAASAGRLRLEGRCIVLSAAEQ